MKKNILSVVILLSAINVQAQVKLYNTNLPYFNKTNLVKPAKTVNNVNFLTKKATNIIQYNTMGQLHGINIEYRNDTSVGLIRYYHNNKLIYIAQPFMNGNAIQKVFNFNDNGSYNGVQAYTYVSPDTNKWVKTEFMYNNGRLVSIDNALKFPNYTVDFKEGKLNGEFYFYDSVYCSCYYYGFAQEGKIKNIAKFEIGQDLSFRKTFYILKDQSIKSTTVFDYRTPFIENIEISGIPVVVENKNIQVENHDKRIVFDKQLNWMFVLTSNEKLQDNGLDGIDWSEASVGPPSPYTLPQRQH
ncbi:hypothetical protein [Chryseobacterium sp. JK1]|uniref:hypothetical protein n=1 Tax=Chryseobacterium sp. JK1 TaxID=874294 RepID=UPI003D69507F